MGEMSAMNDNEKVLEQETQFPEIEFSEQDQLKKELEVCKSENSEWKDKCIRVTADFENYKKRIEQEQKVWMGTAQADILGDLLPIVDDFERALLQEQKKETVTELVSLLEGYSLIYQMLQKLLTQYGVEKITEHDKFNPIYHEALMQVDSSEHESGQIVAVMQKGYRFKGKVLRPAKVSVAK